MPVYADIIILALVAGFILLRLRSILGEDSGFDGQNNDPASKDNSAPTKNEAKVLPINPRDFARKLEQEINSAVADKELIDALDGSDQKTIAAIKAIEPEFDLKRFIDGAKGAFEMVLKAFHANDAETLRYLLADDIEEMFVKEAQAMQDSEIKTETTLVSIAEAVVTDVNLRKKHASISVRFISEQISIERSKDGEVVGGDASRVERVEDEWTFERDLGAKHPNWIVTAT